MRGHPLEFIKDLIIREEVDVENRVYALRVPGKGDIEPFEHAFPRHKRFSGAALFPRAAEQLYRAGPFVRFQIGFYRKGRSDGAAREQVVAAPVPVAVFDNRLAHGGVRLLAQPRQRVELRKDPDHRFPRSVCRAERGLDLSDAFLHLKSVFAQDLFQQLCGFEFLKSGLRIIPDVVRHIDQRILLLIQIFVHLRFIHSNKTSFRVCKTSKAPI